MGIYHQGGMTPAQLWLGQQQQHELKIKEVYWWRTYSPPIWLLGGNKVVTKDLMGMKAEDMMERLMEAIGPCKAKEPWSVGLVAPWSSIDLETWAEEKHAEISFERLWMSKNHLNLDDLDFEEDGIRGTLARVIGRRGLIIWRASRVCQDA